MNPDKALKIQAYLDGELSDREARGVSEWLATDNEARLLFEELQMTSTALAKNEPEMKLPESREFYWSKIQREIRLQEQTPARAAQPVSIMGWLHRFLVPAAGVALVAGVAVLAINKDRYSTYNEFAVVESPVEDMSAFTFRNQAERMTVVWLSDRNDNSGVANDAGTANPYE